MNEYSYKEGLQSERLYTRKLTLGHVPAWAEFFKDPVATEFLGTHVKETHEESARVWIERQMNRYEDSLYGLQALHDKHTGEFIGLCGLIMQDMNGDMQLEVGYHILSRHWGKGYAPEAARLFIDYAFDELQKDTIISIIVVGNTKSERVAQKNGLWPERRVEWKGYDVNLFRMDKDKWKQNSK